MGRTKSPGMMLLKLVGLKKNELVQTAKARVLTARNSPRARRAGSPTSPASTAPPTAARARHWNRSMLAFSIRSPARIPPAPARANWPRLTVPPQPDRTTSDTATRPKVKAMVYSSVVPGPPSTGISSATAATTSPSTPRAMRTSGRRRNIGGMGRATPVASHCDPSSRPRPDLPRRTSMAMRTKASRATSVTDSRVMLNPTTALMTPRPMLDQ